MDCTGCGACCLDESVPVRPWKGDTVADEYIDEEGCLKKINGHCVFFDPEARACTNYEGRPSLCKSLDVGCGRCHLARLWAGMCLGWFTPGTISLPIPLGSYETFYANVVHVPNSMKIESFAGTGTQKNAQAIQNYNSMVGTGLSW